MGLPRSPLRAAAAAGVFALSGCHTYLPVETPAPGSVARPPDGSGAGGADPMLETPSTKESARLQFERMVSPVPRPGEWARLSRPDGGGRP